MLPSILRDIVAHKQDEVASGKRLCPAPAVEEAPPPRDFALALRRPTVALIAEVKQASPSRGQFLSDFDPVAIAQTYAENGAACISVLTDRRFFRGESEHLRAVRRAVTLPLLRKDFVLDEWQVRESRALGADCILLIAAVLSTGQLCEFRDQAAALGMAALVEVHTGEELEAALQIGPALLGINNRDLHTFETDLATTEDLAGPARAGDRLLVSESGIFTPADVARVARAGVDAVLVGEALVRGDTAAATRELSSVPRS